MNRNRSDARLRTDAIVAVILIALALGTAALIGQAIADVFASVETAFEEARP